MRKIQFPPFYKENPEVWFCRILPTLTLAEPKSEAEKFCLFVTNVEDEVLALFTDITISANYTSSIFSFVDYLNEVLEKIRSSFSKLGPIKFAKLFTATPTQVTPAKKYPSVILPSFCVDDPETWFNLIEILFSHANVTSEEEKCYHFMANLDSDVLPIFKHMIPVTSMAELKLKILNLHKTGGLSQYTKKQDDNIFMTKQMMELEEKIINSVEKKLEVALEKMTKNNDNDNNSLEIRFIKLEDKMKDCVTQTITANIVDLKRKIDDSIVANADLDKRIKAIEENRKYYNSEKQMAMVKNDERMDSSSKELQRKDLTELKKMFL